MDLVLEGGFADPVFAAQTVFRAVMDALARPGTAQPLGALARPPAPMTAELGALALALVDHDSPVWLDPALAGTPAVAEWLRFHTGAPVVTDPGAAMFAFISDLAGMPALDSFAQGTDEYPDRSTTLLVAVRSLSDGSALTLRGPGIESVASIAPLPWPDELGVQWAENRERFPRGIDLVLTAPGQVAGLPRTSRIVEG